MQLLGEVTARWQKRDDTRSVAIPALELLVQVQLEEGKWSAAFPFVHDLLARPSSDTETEQRLRWLLRVGEQALKEGNRTEALHAVQEAQAFLSRDSKLAGEFDRLGKRAEQSP